MGKAQLSLLVRANCAAFCVHLFLNRARPHLPTARGARNMRVAAAFGHNRWMMNFAVARSGFAHGVRARCVTLLARTQIRRLFAFY